MSTLYYNGNRIILDQYISFIPGSTKWFLKSCIEKHIMEFDHSSGSLVTLIGILVNYGCLALLSSYASEGNGILDCSNG